VATEPTKSVKSSRLTCMNRRSTRFSEYVFIGMTRVHFPAAPDKKRREIVFKQYISFRDK
jgi:hypothetical protein